MFGCYRKQDANDPEIYVAAIGATLNEFPPAVIDFVTDPRTGLPSRLKWLPTVAEVREACEVRFETAKNILRLKEMAEEKQRIIDRNDTTPSQKSGARSWLDEIDRKFPDLLK